MPLISDEILDQLFHEFCQLPSLESPINLDDLQLWVDWVKKVNGLYDGISATCLETSDIFNLTVNIAGTFWNLFAVFRDFQKEITDEQYIIFKA